MLKIAVVDGQGGGIGSLIVKRLREEFKDAIVITALGTNAVATTYMMKAGADRGASGENAIIWNAAKMDIILGPVSIMLPNAMLGELTAGMAGALSSSPARKMLIPLHQEQVDIIGVTKEPLPHLVEELINRIKDMIISGS
jgi:NAD(P)-dependent dehydrogenase (short-subunit alcohol dehydrogenase family)